MTAQELNKTALAAAGKTLAEAGQVPGMVLLHAKGNIYPMPYKDGSISIGLQQRIITGVIKICRDEGYFRGVVMVSEAWMAVQTNDALVGVLRPAQDPDRKEIVVTYARGDDGSKQMVTTDIVRKDGQVSLGESTIIEHEVSSWLDDAFKD